MEPGGARGDLGLGWSGPHLDQVLLVLSEIVGYLDLPLDEALPRVEGENHRHILAEDGDRVGLLIQSEACLDAEEVLKGEGCLGLPLLVAVLAVPVQLQVEAICYWRYFSDDAPSRLPLLAIPELDSAFDDGGIIHVHIGTMSQTRGR